MSVQKREGGHRRRNHEILRGALRLTMACEGPRKGMKVDCGTRAGFKPASTGDWGRGGWIPAPVKTGAGSSRGIWEVRMDSRLRGNNGGEGGSVTVPYGMDWGPASNVLVESIFSSNDLSVEVQCGHGGGKSPRWRDPCTGTDKLAVSAALH